MSRYEMKYTHKTGKYMIGDVINNEIEQNCVMFKEKDWANYYNLDIQNDSLIGAYVVFGTDIFYLSDFK